MVTHQMEKRERTCDDGRTSKDTLLSVIIPIYNVEQYLEKCIQSVRNQTYTNLQIILVDDGSTDASGKICDKFQKIDSRIQVIHKPNGGLVSARKEGIKLAKGDYVSNIDSDDWMEPDMLEQLYCAAQESGAEVVCSGHYVDMGGKSKVMKNQISPGIYSLEAIRTKVLYHGSFYEGGITSYVWSKLFRRDVLKENQCLVDEQICIGEDIAVGIPAILSAKRICIVDYIGYHYVQRSNSIIHIKDELEMERNIALLLHLAKCLTGKPEQNVLLRQLGQYAKNLFLLRQIWWFDRQGDKILTPYGGVLTGSKIVIYGAGALGKSIRQYLTETNKAQVVGWYDREFEAFLQEGYPVQNPIDLTSHQFDYILIASITEAAARSIKADLIQAEVPDEKMLWLSDQFIDENNNMVMDWLLESNQKEVLKYL